MNIKDYKKYFALIIAKNPGIEIVFASNKSAESSHTYIAGKRIVLGTLELNGESPQFEKVITCLLHEMGHLRTSKKGFIEREFAAWRIAKDFAKKYNIPFDDIAMRNFLSTYEFYIKAAEEVIAPCLKEEYDSKKVLEAFLMKLSAARFKNKN